MPTAEAALRRARRHVEEGARIVDEQSARIARMAPDGSQIAAARTLLETMKVTLELFRTDLARLEAKS
ncbi:MAG TPA: hypothetical protein VFM98_24740 [Ramlibacter sp.]|uniref:hypothetical protein n=1 Tax=Ramlibacter sp. TaxID=1917967 RepID=UPI002D7F497F|nr:hypothetical protein [Ramlibacter sp.]HET8748824.1 hypothetical protein [Ramlibacter sp.]